MKPILVVLAAMIISAFTTLAFAAPFCVEVTGVPPQCLYVDPSLCQHDATSRGGRCAANPGEFRTPAGGAPFCVVQSGNVPSCIYPDRASCEAASERVRGACIAAAPRPAAKPALDPYRLKRPY